VCPSPRLLASSTSVSPRSQALRQARRLRGASLEPRKGGGAGPREGGPDPTQKKLLEEEDVHERPAATASERRCYSERLTGKSLGVSTISKASPQKRLGFGQKNGPWGALERDEWLRAAWRVLVAQKTEPERLVFVDEMGTNTSLSPLRAWSRRAERARWAVPCNRGKNTTLLLWSMSVEGMGPSLAITGSVDAPVFEAYLERILLSYYRSFIRGGSW
jgi:hypothetical protein